MKTLALLISIVAISLLLVSCGHSMEELIVDYITELPTYQAGGYDLNLTEHSGNSYTFQFKKPYAGYGKDADRIEQEVLHTVQVETKNREITSIGIDGHWDALEQQAPGTSFQRNLAEGYSVICADEDTALFGISDDVLTITSIIKGDFCGPCEYEITKDLESYPPTMTVELIPKLGECERLECPVTSVIHTIEIDSLGTIGDLIITHDGKVLAEQKFEDWSCVEPEDCPRGYVCSFVEDSDVNLCIIESWKANQTYYDEIAHERTQKITSHDVGD